jgi:hypothetical protein
MKWPIQKLLEENPSVHLPHDEQTFTLITRVCLYARAAFRLLLFSLKGLRGYNRTSYQCCPFYSFCYGQFLRKLKIHDINRYFPHKGNENIIMHAWFNLQVHSIRESNKIKSRRLAFLTKKILSES